MNKIVKRILIISGIVIGTVVLGAGGYVGYIILSYNRIGDKAIDVDGVSTLAKVETGTTYKAISYNIGFGAYSQDYTFFLDGGYDENGNETVGHWSTARSKEDVMFNTNGAIETLKNSGADFVYMQEVDTDSTRSKKVNQDKLARAAFPSYDHTHCVNYHMPFLPYPLYDMHGYVNAGLTTMSKYKVADAERKEYTVSDSLSKLIDLDRCFCSNRVEVGNGKSLYIINSHMSAYDEGGTIRAAQTKQLGDYIAEKRNKGDYVLVGGDWNHDLLTYSPDFSYSSSSRPFKQTLKEPDWLQHWYDESGKGLIEGGFHMYASDNAPTCRNNDIEWEPGKTFVCAVDGFLASDNIEVLGLETIVTKKGNKNLDGFAYSDHEPVTISFRLKA